MALAVFCQAVRSRWQAFTQLVWPESPQQQTQAEIDRLTADLARRYQRLVQRRCRIEQLRDRLAQQEKQLGDPSAGPLPCEELQRAIQRNRSRLQRHEDAYGRQRQRFEGKKQLRLAMLRGQVVVAGQQSEG